MKQFTLLLSLLCLHIVLFGVQPTSEANAVDCELSYSIAIDTTHKETVIEKTKTKQSPDKKKRLISNDQRFLKFQLLSR